MNDLKVNFPDGNIIHISNNKCSSPNALFVDIIDLVPGKKYTVFINNLNTTSVTLFPSSFSFVAEAPTKRLTFYHQFD